MKILLLGSNGQLGDDLKKIILNKKNNFNLKTLDRVDLDVENTNLIREKIIDIDFDILINCTSYHKTDEVEDHPKKALNINSKAVREIAKVCKEKKSKIIHISTDYVFSGKKITPYNETDNIGPLNIYGLTKSLGENYIQHETDDFYIFRVASLFGESGASGKGGNFIETMIKMANEGKEIKVVDDIIMSPTSTITVANSIIELINLSSQSGIYHLVNSGHASWHEFALQIFKKMDISYEVKPIKSINYPTNATRPAFSVLNNSKIQSETKNKIVDWKIALEDYLRLKGHIIQ